MTGFFSLALAACLLLRPDADTIQTGDLAPASSSLRQLPPDIVLAPAPAPGMPRIFHAAELRRLELRLGASPVSAEDLCIGRPMAPLEPARILEAMRRQLPEGQIDLLDFSRRLAPQGTLEFPLSGLRRGSAVYWDGFVSYGGRQRFAVWAKVRVRLTARVVVAAETLAAGRPVSAAQLREVERDVPPRSGLIQKIEDAVGKQPRRSIRVGTMLLPDDLERTPDVARGDRVTVEVWSGRAHLELDARAETAGSAGERVAVQNPNSKQRFFARVEGKGRVSVGKARI
jgi:flagella basal body P-ring formation protein FlgA